MTEQTSTDLRAADRGPAVGRIRPGGGAVAALTGLCLGLLALGPGLGPGYLLSYDLVFVPDPQFNAATFGLAGTLPRAVPSDAVVAVLARALPADVIQKLVLLGIFALACAGAARLLSAERWPARIAAGRSVRLEPVRGRAAAARPVGDFARVRRPALGPRRPDEAVGRLLRRTARLGIALLPAAVGGFAAMSISGLVALPTAACQRGTAKSRLVGSAAVLFVLAMLSLPWLIPALTQPVHTSPAAVAAFAARADTPFGTAGSLLALGGAWNAQTVPAGYGGVGSAFWLCLALGSLAGFVLLGRRRWPGLGTGAVVGLLIALVGALGAGQDLLRAMITAWPGFAVLRDGQQFVAPLALAEAVGLGLCVARLLRARRPAFLREGKPIVAAAMIVAPVLLLPGLAWGAAGRLRPVEYPADWLAARRLINADPGPGSALLLPWGAYRRFGWNHGEAVLDPWPRLLAREVTWDDGVQVGSARIPPESRAAQAIGRLVMAGVR